KSPAVENSFRIERSLYRAHAAEIVARCSPRVEVTLALSGTMRHHRGGILGQRRTERRNRGGVLHGRGRVNRKWDEGNSQRADRRASHECGNKVVVHRCLLCAGANSSGSRGAVGSAKYSSVREETISKHMGASGDCRRRSRNPNASLSEANSISKVRSSTWRSGLGKTLKLALLMTARVPWLPMSSFIRS